MRFYCLPDSIIKKHRDITKLKVEYFWHFWDFLFTDNRNLILVNESKFTSQVSLLNKIEKHLEWNNRVNSQTLIKYCNSHPYFNQSNLILRSNSELKLKLIQLKRDIENFEINNRQHLLQSVILIKKDFFKAEKYSEEIINRLVKIIFSSKELNKVCKQDLKFLCNSIIDLLIIRGYSLQFIKRTFK